MQLTTSKLKMKLGFEKKYTYCGRNKQKNNKTMITKIKFHPISINKKIIEKSRNSQLITSTRNFY